MSAPAGYTPLGVIGYSDKGTYDATATYNKYNTVSTLDGVWVCLLNGTTGVRPVEGANWHLMIASPDMGVLQNLATVEESTTSSKAYAVGDYLTLNGILYRTTVAIAQGGTIVTDTDDPDCNVAATTVAEELENERTVGYLYETTGSKSPAELFGGTWSLIETVNDLKRYVRIDGNGQVPTIPHFLTVQDSLSSTSTTQPPSANALKLTYDELQNVNSVKLNKSEFEKNTYASTLAVNLTNYTQTSLFTVPDDGYVTCTAGRLINTSTSESDVFINSTQVMRQFYTGTQGSNQSIMFVKKGMKMYATTVGNGSASYIPLK